MTSEQALQCLTIPPSEWQAMLDAMPTSERGRLSDYLHTIAWQSARLGEYASYREGFGCGDQGHADADKAARKMATKVRRALGYSRPQVC